LKNVKNAAETTEEDIQRLINEVEALKAMHGELEQEFGRRAKDDSSSQEESVLWFNTAKTLENGQALVKRLDQSVGQIYGDDRSVAGKRDGLLKQHRKRNQQVVISGFRSQINLCHSGLKIWLDRILM
jgi:hypothetical protein